jgi:hypothetical protein
MGCSCLFEGLAGQRRAHQQRRSFAEVMVVTLARGPPDFRGLPYSQQMTLFL